MYPQGRLNVDAKQQDERIKDKSSSSFDLHKAALAELEARITVASTSWTYPFFHMRERASSLLTLDLLPIPARKVEQMLQDLSARFDGAPDLIHPIEVCVRGGHIGDACKRHVHMCVHSLTCECFYLSTCQVIEVELTAILVDLQVTL